MKIIITTELTNNQVEILALAKWYQIPDKDAPDYGEFIKNVYTAMIIVDTKNTFIRVADATQHEATLARNVEIEEQVSSSIFSSIE